MPSKNYTGLFLVKKCYNGAVSGYVFQKLMIFASIPVVIAFSLCYAATRYEEMPSILRHALYFGGWLAFAMILVIGFLELIQLYLR